MTAAEYETWFAREHRMTVADLHASGRRATRCDCGRSECKGWVIVKDEQHAH